MCFNRHRCGTSSHSRRRWSEGRRRSNVESMFSMVKAKFRDHVRSKTDTPMKNEVLCKFLGTQQLPDFRDVRTEHRAGILDENDSRLISRQFTHRLHFMSDKPTDPV